jgi:uncharacterized protein
MSKTVETLLAELKSGLKGLYSERLRALYLYGSYARGKAGPESDLDVLIVLDQLDSYRAEVDRTSKLASDVSLKYGISVSRVFASERDWQKGGGCSSRVSARSRFQLEYRSPKAAGESAARHSRGGDTASTRDVDFAAGRAYYAMFYIAEALLSEKGFRSRKHGGVGLAEAPCPQDIAATLCQRTWHGRLMLKADETVAPGGIKPLPGNIPSVVDS